MSIYRCYCSVQDDEFARFFYRPEQSVCKRFLYDIVASASFPPLPVRSRTTLCRQGLASGPDGAHARREVLWSAPLCRLFGCCPAGAEVAKVGAKIILCFQMAKYGRLYLVFRYLNLRLLTCLFKQLTLHFNSLKCRVRVVECRFTPREVTVQRC